MDGDGEGYSNISWILALQLTTLASIATALLLYLVCSGRNPRAGRRKICGPIYYYGSDPNEASECGSGRAILVTACDGALGLQIAKHLHTLGFRVFAGFREPEKSIGARVLVAASTPDISANNDGESTQIRPPICPIKLDVTREDLLHDAVDVIRRHLPASQQGLWGVVNTAGLCCRGRLEAQDGSVWDAMLRLNVVGSLRAARALLPLLRNKRGRLINLGAPSAIQSKDCSNAANGLVAYTAVRYAVEGASKALRNEVAPLGIHVISLQPEPSAFPERYFASPRFPSTISGVEGSEEELPSTEEACKLLAKADVLPDMALRQLEEALLATAPHETYSLTSQPSGIAGLWMDTVSSINSLLRRDKNETTALMKQPC